ncbi:MAG: YhfC family intramembrane metalloprotease [Anaerolineales bacterium]|nr:YhfC family intramembrane metalloprotease [Anaerolineales bacterium]
MSVEEINPILQITHPLNGLLMIAIPVGLGIYIVRRFKLSWRFFFIGGLVFILSQVFRFPFIWGTSFAFERGILPPISPNWHFTFNLLFLSISAGVFEESARYLMYRWWVKDARSWRQGILLGTGHGGFEAIILGVLVLFGFFQMMAILGQDLATLVDASQLSLAEQQVQEYWTLPWYLTLFGALERAFIILLHISLSLMVLQVFIRRQIRWLALAFGWHALVNAVGVYLLNTSGMIAAEVGIGLGAIVSIGIIIQLRDADAPPDRTLNEPPLPKHKRLSKIDTVEENHDVIERTRYTE